MYYLVWDAAFTKFFITPLTLSRHHKLTASKTLPSSFTMNSTPLKSTLVICLSICRIVRKKCNLDVSRSKIRSQDQFQKKIQLKFKQSGKMLPNHNSVLAEHISNLGPEKKLGQDTRWPKMVWELKKARKSEITTFWIEKCPKCLRCPGTQTSQNLVGKMCKNKF